MVTDRNRSPSVVLHGETDAARVWVTVDAVAS